MRLANIGQSIGWAIVSTLALSLFVPATFAEGDECITERRVGKFERQDDGVWIGKSDSHCPGMTIEECWEEEIHGTLEDRAPCWYLDGRPWRKSRPLSIGVECPSFSQIRKKNKIDQNRDGYINYSFWTYWVYDPKDDPGYRWVGKCTDGPDGSATREPFDY